MSYRYEDHSKAVMILGLFGVVTFMITMRRVQPEGFLAASLREGR